MDGRRVRRIHTTLDWPLSPPPRRSQINGMRIAIATCKAPPEPDPDEALLLDALRGSGLEASVLAWDDADAQERLRAADLVVLRSTWNYYQDVDAFLAWVTAIGGVTKLLNPPSIVRWNAEKSYLFDLEKRGVDIVPTERVRRGERRALAEILDARRWDEVVIKPLVSAGSFRTERFSRASLSAGQEFLDGLVLDRDAMVQRWMPSVETYGERSLVWIDGEITHAIRKTPRFAGGVEQVSGAVPVADDERAFAMRAVEPFASGPDRLLYARIDMVRDADGVLRIMELELIEPSLFFQQSPAALARFVAAIRRRLRKVDPS